MSEALVDNNVTREDLLQDLTLPRLYRAFLAEMYRKAAELENGIKILKEDPRSALHWKTYQRHRGLDMIERLRAVGYVNVAELAELENQSVSMNATASILECLRGGLEIGNVDVAVIVIRHQVKDPREIDCDPKPGDAYQWIQKNQLHFNQLVHVLLTHHEAHDRVYRSMIEHAGEDIGEIDLAHRYHQHFLNQHPRWCQE